VGDCRPDITFVLDVDAATAQSRMQQSVRRPDRMEQQPAEFYEDVRKAYRQLASREPDRIVLLDGARLAEKIESEIWQLLISRFPALANKSQT
jgi:dTMP kinase